MVPQTEYSGELTMPLGGSITMLDVHTQLNIRYRLKLATCLLATDPTSGVRFTICCRSQSSCYYTTGWDTEWVMRVKLKPKPLFGMARVKRVKR